MSHHGNNFDDLPESELMRKFKDALLEEKNESLQEAMSKCYGEYPDGRLNKEDEGAIPMITRIENGRVILDFGKQVTWIGFEPEQAMSLAESLIKRAREAGSNRMLSIEI